jgi:hypothetical protein
MVSAAVIDLAHPGGKVTLMHLISINAAIVDFADITVVGRICVARFVE